MSDSVLLGIYRGNFFSLRKILERFFWPTDIFPLPDIPAIDESGVIDFLPRVDEEGVYDISIAIVGEISFFNEELGIEVVLFAGNAGLSTFSVSLDTDPIPEVSFDCNIAIRFSPTVLKPVNSDLESISFNEADRSYWSKIECSVGLTIDSEGNLSISSGSNGISMDRSMISDTGIIIAADQIVLSLSKKVSPVEIINAGYDESFIGVYIRYGEIAIPFLSTVDETDTHIRLTIILEDAVIGSGGFSGGVSAEWDVLLAQDKKSFIDEGCGLKCQLWDDFEMALQRVSIVFDKNIPSEFSIEGALLLPFFDSIVDVELSLGEGGEILVGLRGLGEEGLLKLTKEDLFELTVNAFRFERNEEEIAFTVDGDFQITATDKIPKFALQGISIYKKREENWSNTRLRLKGGILDINKCFDFNAFMICISQFGLGQEDRSGNNGLETWNTVFFSGGIILLEGINAGAWVKGLRIPFIARPPGQEPRFEVDGLTLDGAGLLVVCPDTFAFMGEIEHVEEPGKSLFRGGVALTIIPIGIGIDAQLIIGRNPECAFAYVYVKIAGFYTQLGSLPLYLRAIEGLNGINVTLNADNIYDFFPLSERIPKGITHASKWRDECGAFAIGLGVDISTASDRLFYMNALLALLVGDRELVFLIEGKAFVLQKPSPGKEPPFHSLMVLQALPEFAALINVSAQYEFIKGVLEAHGVMEAYYGPNPDPNSPGKTTWYYTLGQITPYFPVDKPIRANVLQVFKATGYFMVMPGLWAVGAQIGISRRYNFKVASVKFEALINGEMLLRWDPNQIKGFLELAGAVGFRLYRIGFDISLYASVLGMAPDWYVYALLRFSVTVNLRLKKFKFKAELPFKWEKRRTPPIPDVFEGLQWVHLITLDTWDPLLNDDGLPAFNDVPNGEPDSSPVITFRFPIRDRTQLPFGQNIAHIPDHKSGDYTFRAELPGPWSTGNAPAGVRMWRCPIDYEADDYYRDGDGNPAWEEFVNPINSDIYKQPVPKFYGAWLAIESPDGVLGGTVLQLFTRTPFEFDSHRVLTREDFTRVFDQEMVPFAEGIASGSAEIAYSSLGLSSGNPHTILPVAPVIQPSTFIKTDTSAANYPLGSLNMIKNEYPRYPFTELEGKFEKRSANFLHSDPGEYPRRETVEIGDIDFGSSLGLKIILTDHYPHPMKYLEVIGDQKHPNQLFISLKNPTRQVEINFIATQSSKKLPLIEVVSAYKRRNPELGPWNFKDRETVPVTAQLNNRSVSVLVDHENRNEGDPSSFDLLQLQIGHPLKVLSASYEIDWGEELSTTTDQLERYLDMTYRQGDYISIPGSSVFYISEESGDDTPEGAMLPGYVYKLQVQTNVSRTKGGASSHRESTRYAYLMVKDPPKSLTPYLLKTFPTDVGYPHYRARELFIRYLKNYVHKFFPHGYDKLVWKITNDEEPDPIVLPYHEHYYQSQEEFIQDRSEERIGWQWGKANTHTLTKEELVWMEAYNQNVSEGEQLTEGMIIGDDMMWLYTPDPVLIRETFTAYTSSDNGPGGNLFDRFDIYAEDGSPLGSDESSSWFFSDGMLCHETPPSDDSAINSETMLLSKTLVNTDFVVSAFVKTSMASGRTGFIFLTNGSGPSLPYMKITFDLDNARISLIKTSTDSSVDPEYISDKKFHLGSNSWSKISFAIRQGSDINGNGKLLLTVMKGDEILLDSSVEISDGGSWASGYVGAFASSDFTGWFDNLEVLSLDRLQKLPKSGITNHLTMTYEGQQERKSMLEFSFNPSKHIDFFDHMNSWNRTIYVSPEDSNGIDAGVVNSWLTLKGSPSNPDQGTLLELMGRLEDDKERLVLKMLVENTVEDVSEATLNNTKQALKEVRYDIDQRFQEMAESLGFNITSRQEKFELTLSSDAYVLMLSNPEPIDWTRISVGPVRHLSAEIDTPQTTYDTLVVHSSDMTRALILIKESGSFVQFSRGEMYKWIVESDSHIPDSRRWIEPWIKDRCKPYEFRFEIPE